MNEKLRTNDPLKLHDYLLKGAIYAAVMVVCSFALGVLFYPSGIVFHYTFAAGIVGFLGCMTACTIFAVITSCGN